MAARNRLVLIASLTVTALPSAGSAQTLDQLISRAKHLYESSHTVQFDMKVTGVETNRKNYAKFQVWCEVNQDGTSRRGRIDIHKFEAGVESTSRIIDDGTWTYTIDDKGKQYSRKKHVSESVFAVFSVATRIASASGSAVVRESKDHQFLIATKLVNSVQVEIRFAKKNGALLNIHAIGVGDVPKEPYGVELLNQSFNKPIPASVFQVRPPAGYKKQVGSL